MSTANGLEIDDVIEFLSILADDANLRVSVEESLKGGLIAGLATVIGGLLGGKTGLAVGAVAGGIGAAVMAKDFQSVGSVLLQMNREKKELLFAKVKECLGKASIDDIGKLHKAIEDPEMKTKLLKAVVDHVEGQLHIHIVD